MRTSLVLLWALLGVLVGCATSAPTQPAAGPSGPPPPGTPPPLRTTVFAKDLVRLTSDPGQELWPAPSPDGHRLLFSVSQGRDDAAIALQELGPPAAFKLLTPSALWSGFPAWQPDGTSYVFERNGSGKCELVTSPVSANVEPTVLVHGDTTTYPRRPAVSPDGQRMLYVTGMGADATLQMLAHGASQALGPGNDPVWSPDGHRIAFARFTAGRSQVFTMDPDSGAAPVQLTWGDFNSGQPAWSPDGGWLAFASDRHFNPYGQTVPNGVGGGFHRGRSRGGRPSGPTPSSLYVMRPDGSQVVPLTEGGYDSGMPSWGRDGFLYFSSNALGTFDVWRLAPLPTPAVTPGAPSAPQTNTAPGL